MTTEGIHLDTGLWIDRPDAIERIRRRREAEELSPVEADRLERFAREGYVVFDLGVDETTLDRVVQDVDRLWEERPADVAFAYDGPPRSMGEAEEDLHRKPRHRLHDIHSHSVAARDLYLHPQIFEIVDLILGGDAVAVQSLYFEYGSQQVLHRDPVVVPTAKPGHLVAAWIALEDISPDSGALAYVPGSHRLPYYEFRPGQWEFDASTMGEEEVEGATRFDDEQMRRRGLEPRLFLADKGQVLLWHSGLRHGGGPVRDESLTRKSFVVHFSTLETYEARSITIRVPDPAGGERSVVMETRELLERDGRRGFDSPMRGYDRPGPLP